MPILLPHQVVPLGSDWSFSGADAIVLLDNCIPNASLKVEAFVKQPERSCSKIHKRMPSIFLQTGVICTVEEASHTMALNGHF